MPKHYCFCYKVEQLIVKGQNDNVETAVNNTRKDAFMALVRAVAGNPSGYEGLKDGEFKDFRDNKTGAVYRIWFNCLNL